MSAEPQYIFKVSFVSHDEIYEVFCRSVSPSDMYGFVCIEEFVFGEASTVVVDPTEERIKSEFKNVKASFIPMHSILRIDEIERKEVSPKIKNVSDAGKKVSQFPSPIYTPSGE